MTAARQAAERRGNRAEDLCCLLLRLKGYRVLDRRLRTPLGEIDIVARRGQVLAVIEVKARANREDAGGALSPRQRDRLGRAARWLLSGRPDLARLSVRFDAMLVAPWRWPRHLPGAWAQDG